MINLRKILILSAILIPVLLIIFTLAGILNKTSRIEDRIISEFQANNEQIEGIKQNIIKMSLDLNQTRNLVGLPESEYSFEAAEKKNKNITKSDKNNSVYFMGFEYLKNHFNEVELFRKLSDLAENDIFKSSVEKNNLIIKESDSSYLLYDKFSDNILYSLKADNTQNSIIIKSGFSSIAEKVLETQSAQNASDYLNMNTAEVRNLDLKLSEKIVKMKNISSDNIIKTVFRKNKLYLDNYSSGIDKTSIFIKRESGVSIASVVLNHSDLTYSFCNNKYSEFNELKNDLLNINNICDIRTLDEKRIEKSKNDINILADDISFINYLADNGYSLSGEIREDNDYLYYDIIEKGSGSKIGSFAVHKVNGEIYLTDHEEVPISSLNRFGANTKKKN